MFLLYFTSSLFFTVKKSCTVLRLSKKKKKISEQINKGKSKYKIKIFLYNLTKKILVKYKKVQEITQEYA